MHTKVQSLRDEVHLCVISEQVSLCEEPNPNRIRMSFYCQVCLHVFILMTEAFTVQQNDKDKDEWRGHWTSPADHMLKHWPSSKHICYSPHWDCIRLTSNEIIALTGKISDSN